MYYRNINKTVGKDLRSDSKEKSTKQLTTENKSF